MRDALQEVLAQHMSNDDLIKGWEANRRICIGRDRGPLRKASRDVNAIREGVLAGKVSEAGKRKYLTCIETLHIELAKAQEQDFDGMLGEALAWLKARETGSMDARLPTPAALTDDQKEALERVRDYRFINSPGHVGRAIDRDLRLATNIAKEIRVGLASMASAANEQDLVSATGTYVDAVDRFTKALRQAGEPDFDGLLRQAVLILDSAPAAGESESVHTAVQIQFGKGAARQNSSGNLQQPVLRGKGKGERRWKESSKKEESGYSGTNDGYSDTWETNANCGISASGRSMEAGDTQRPRRWVAKKASHVETWTGAY